MFWVRSREDFSGADRVERGWRKVFEMVLKSGGKRVRRTEGGGMLDGRVVMGGVIALWFRADKLVMICAGTAISGSGGRSLSSGAFVV